MEEKKLINKQVGSKLDKKTNKDYPLISIITVVLNGEKFLEETILSVINQDYKNIEYIIVDGESTDGSLKIIQKYAKYIDHLISEKDKGIYDAMNKGIKLATGQILNMMNCGDYYSSKNIVTQVANIFKQNNSLNFVLGKCKFVNDDGSDYTIRQNKPVLTTLKAGRFNTICHQAFFYKKSLHDQFGLYTLKYKVCSDGQFMYRVYHSSKYQRQLFNQIFSVRRKEGISTSLQSLREHKQMYDEVFGKSLINQLVTVKYHLKNNFFGRKLYEFYERIKHLFR